MEEKIDESIEFIDKENCYGCTACYSICPKNAIIMEYDAEGFIYPIIRDEICIKCGLCKSICPSLYKKSNGSLNKPYVALNKDEKSRLTSSSGGIFEVLAKYILRENGIVIGASFDKENVLYHTIVSDINELDKLKGSKYLQSNLGDVFKIIKNYLEDDNKVLFVGTPCQIAGLKSYLKHEYENLYCCDFICHGVPSTKVFNKYISELELKNGKVIGSVNFRNKDNGWKNFHMSFKQEKINYFTKYSEDIYMKLFLSDICLRSSCYNCKFKLGNKYSDITLGDFWKVDNYYPELNDNKGTSAVIINTDKGNLIFNGISKDLIYKECNIEEILHGNLMLKYSSKKHINRDDFFRDLDKEYNLEKLYNKYVRGNIVKRIFRRINNFKFK